MKNLDIQTRLIKHIEDKWKCKIIDKSTPLQGMSSRVIFFKISNDLEYVIKFGKDAMKDVSAIQLIKKAKIDIPVPNLIEYFTFEKISVIILEKIDYPLLETVQTKQIGKYIPSMITNIKKLHTIKSDKPSNLVNINDVMSWKEIILSIFKDAHYWKEVSLRNGIDGLLILDSIEKIINNINKIVFPENNFSLLHTDFNQRNLFIDPNSNQIKGIIDWEEAVFGDPVYDMARIRMLIWHFDLGEKVLRNYYKVLNYSEAELEREEVYWVLRIIQYLGWYSEELTEFNKDRIELHQNFLRHYNW